MNNQELTCNALYKSGQIKTRLITVKQAVAKPNVAVSPVVILECKLELSYVVSRFLT